MRLRFPATLWLGFVRRGRVAPTAIPITEAGRIASIPVRFQEFVASNRDQRLLSHFDEAGTAVLAVKPLEYSGHDRTLA